MRGLGTGGGSVSDNVDGNWYLIGVGTNFVSMSTSATSAKSSAAAINGGVCLGTPEGMSPLSCFLENGEVG